MNCIYNKYIEATATRSAAKQHRTFRVQTVQCPTEFVLTQITHNLLLHFQLRNSTNLLIYKYLTKFTMCNWTLLTVFKTEAAATCSATQEHSILTVQILYKLYISQKKCTYTNYTEAVTYCSAVQYHVTFTLQLLYKLYNFRKNGTYSNYTEAAATCSAAQKHRTFTAQML